MECDNTTSLLNSGVGGVGETRQHFLRACHLWRPYEESPSHGHGPVPGMMVVPGGSDKQWETMVSLKETVYQLASL